MSINLLGFKAITSAVAGATIIGGGVTLGIYTGGSGSISAAGGGNLVEDPNLSSYSDSLQTFLKKTDDYVADKQTTTNLILARISSKVTATNVNNQNLKCSIETGTDSHCKILLIKPKLTVNNVSKILYSSLKQITNPSLETPENSFVILELTSHTKGLEDFKNKVITVKDGDASLLTLEFDQVLFKKEATIDNKSVDVIYPLKKEVISYLAYSNEITKLFKAGLSNTSFKCSYKTRVSGKSDKEITNVDDSCRLISINYPTDPSKKLTTLKDLLESNKPLTNEDLKGNYDKKYFKIEIDKNKTYNIDLEKATVSEFLDVWSIEGNKESEKVTFTLKQKIEDGKVKGKANWILVKYKGETEQIDFAGNKAACDLIENNSSTDKTNKVCALHEITQPENITSENVNEMVISTTELQGKVSLTKDKYYAIYKWKELPISDLTPNKKIYLTTETLSTKYQFDIVSLLSGSIDKVNYPILITEFSNSAS